MQWCPVSVPQERLVSTVPKEDLTADSVVKSKRVVGGFHPLAKVQELVLIVNELSQVRFWMTNLFSLDARVNWVKK